MGIDWQTQPRDLETGQFMRKKSQRRSRWLKIRITDDDLEMIYQAAACNSLTVTDYVVQSCREGLSGSPARMAAAKPQPFLRHKQLLAARLRRSGKT